MQLGLSLGDRLGIWGPNSSEWFISRLAAARAGLIAVSSMTEANAPCGFLHRSPKFSATAAYKGLC
jgi:acyl-CoA synthetase (AMP-forming)/AMP-acid ligase II